MKIKLTKKYTFEFVLNRGLWYRFKPRPEPSIPTEMSTAQAREYIDSFLRGSSKDDVLKPVFVSYDVGVPSNESSSVCLTQLKILTIFFFQARLYVNGYIYKETKISKRMKYLVNYKLKSKKNIFSSFLPDPNKKDDLVMTLEERIYTTEDFSQNKTENK